MKTYAQILVIYLILPFLSFSQQNLNANNCNALISNSALLFYDEINQLPGYEYPKDSSSSLISNMSFWMSCLDANGVLHVAADAANEDLVPGPITNDYNSNYYLGKFSNSVWEITRDEVNNHVSSYTSPGYFPMNAIANWPGNGNTAEGLAAQLAPYVDVNNDQVYDPMDGDYPYFPGDEAVFLILNDENRPSSNSGLAIGVELHVLLYQFIDQDIDVNNTTFLNVSVFNRRNNNYNNFVLGAYTDFDIGNPTDDYLGSDSLRNMVYAYNGQTTDSGIGSQSGFSNPPVCGLKFLNHNAGGVIAVGLGSGINGIPIGPGDFDNYLHTAWKNGQALSYGGDGTIATAAPAKFFLSGDPFLGTGWTEMLVGNPSGDRRVLLNSSPQNLAINQKLCYDLALVTSDSGNDYLGNVNSLFGASDNIQNFYDLNIPACNQLFLSTPPNYDVEIELFPNPSNGNFVLSGASDFKYAIYDIEGKLVHVHSENSGYHNVNIDLDGGIYLIELIFSDRVVRKKIEILD